MPDFALAFYFASVFAIAAGMSCAGGAVRWRRAHLAHAHLLGAAQAMRDTALAGERTAIRILRLSAHELRGVGMTLQGLADYLADPQSVTSHARAQAHAAGIAGAAAQILGLADELQDHAFPALAPRILREEVVDLAALLAEVVAATANALGPGRRNWRLPDPPLPILLWADRRALRHVIARVLTDAARNTGQDDWIDLSLLVAPHGPLLCVQDEGSGFATPHASPNAADSRGIGLRLTLARSLMEAHGGRLEIEALAQVGCRVSLVFPAGRLRQGGHDPEIPCHRNGMAS
jgi:signal transduction histidine kinase